MALSLDGTTGITSDGGTPVIENLDTTATGIAVTGELTTTGNVGIGTSSPTYKLDVAGTGRIQGIAGINGGVLAGDYALNINTSTGVTGGVVLFNSGASLSTTLSSLSGQGDLRVRDAFPLVFGTSNIERMRIDSSGRFYVNQTAQKGNTLQRMGLTFASNVEWGLNITSSSTATGNAVNFTNSSGTQIGQVQTSTTATSYVTSSDYRLKEDWVAVVDASTRVNALKPVNFAWKVNGERVDGFLAHELQEVVPEAVAGTKDAMRDEEYEVTPAVLDDEGAVVTPAVMGTRSVPDYQGIDQSKLVPLLTAALQEALAAIDNLTARVNALETA